MSPMSNVVDLLQQTVWRDVVAKKDPEAMDIIMILGVFNVDTEKLKSVGPIVTLYTRLGRAKFCLLAAHLFVTRRLTDTTVTRKDWYEAERYLYGADHH